MSSTSRPRTDGLLWVRRDWTVAGITMAEEFAAGWLHGALIGPAPAVDGLLSEAGIAGRGFLAWQQEVGDALIQWLL